MIAYRLCSGAVLDIPLLVKDGLHCTCYLVGSFANPLSLSGPPSPLFKLVMLIPPFHLSLFRVSPPRRSNVTAALPFAPPSPPLPSIVRTLNLYLRQVSLFPAPELGCFFFRDPASRVNIAVSLCFFSFPCAGTSLFESDCRVVWYSAVDPLEDVV